MVIQTSNVALSSYNRTQSRFYESVSYSGWEESVLKATKLSADSTATDGAQTDVQNAANDGKAVIDEISPEERMGNQKRAASIPVSGTSASEFIENALSDAEKIEVKSLQNLLEMISNKVEPRRMTITEMFHSLFDKMKERANKMLSGLYDFQKTQVTDDAFYAVGGATGYSSGGYAPKSLLEGVQTSIRSVNVSVEKTTETFEQTSFASSGTVKTQDGREIDFNLSFEQSRSFCEKTNVEFDFTEIYYMDPLVINCSSDVAEVSDQTFYFDLDCDGEEDNIALLGKACGFLALDRNNDGIINDGSELFGATTGDGFKELAVFDLDGNGWIDENDEIFNHLKIWKRCEDGTSELVGLGVAGIGAIYLGSADTEMSMHSEAGNPLAALRKTGVYLREDGTAGTIQHVDLAKIA